jgi:hypothetical protein
MKLTQDTLDVLKNFSAINPGILIKPGKTIKTIGKNKNILAEYVSQEEFTQKFGIYELPNLLAVLSLEKEIPEIEFDSNKNSMKIVTLSGRRKMEYRFCDEEMITVPPEKDIQMPTPEIKFDLTQEDFTNVERSTRVLSSTHIAIVSDGKKVYLNNYDASNDSAATSELEICDGNGDVYTMIFKEESWKMIPGNYSVSVSSKGVAHFKNKDKNLQYWITIEPGSKYTPK